MTEEIYNLTQQAAKDLAVQQGVLVYEDGFYLNPSTIQLVNEIEATNNIMQLIDVSLDTRDVELFMQLTKKLRETAEN